MTSGTPTIEVKPSRLFSLRTLHLFALSSFAIAEPTLTALIGQTTYVHDQQVGLAEVACLLIWLMVVIPLGWFAVDSIAYYVSRRCHGYGRDTALFMLATILCLTLLRPYVITKMLVKLGLSGLLALGVSLIGASLFVLMYRRFSGFRTWVSVASAGMVVFPAVFVWQFQQLQRSEASLSGIAAQHSVPVVVVVFDEFSGTTLLTEEQTINARRFPNFARLAEQSTFYRNASTVHVRTDFAVPTIISGRYPTLENHSPIAAELPGNMFQVVKASEQFEMAVFEPVTRICPPFYLTNPLPKLSTWERSGELIYTMSTVYPRLVFTNDLPLPLPRIPMKWFGIGYLVHPKRAEWGKMTEGLFHYSGSLNRLEQMEHFLRCLTPGEKSRFAFLHVVFPHVPWSFFPSGEQYQAESAFDNCPAGATGELGEDWLDDPATILRNQYRYELQVGLADRFIGQVLDRLKEAQLLDRCILVVTADHGVSFRAKHSRRLPDSDILPDIASVPLFIKFPGQTEGKIDDRNVQSIDIYPTIAEVLGLTLPEPVDGISVTQDKRHPRKTLCFNGSMTVVEPTLPGRTEAVKREWELFGQRDLEELPEQVSSHPDWIGRPLGSFEIDNSRIPAIVNQPFKSQSSVENLHHTTLLPNFVSGTINESELPESPAELVVSFDGVVQATGRTYWKQARVQGFEFLIPRTQMSESSPKIELFLFDRGRNRLRPLESTPAE